MKPYSIDYQHTRAKTIIKYLLQIIKAIFRYNHKLNMLLNWSVDMIEALKVNDHYPNPNTVFYEDFFSIMIFVDVLLLIISFTFHSSFFIIFRNASFIITTILLRMSLTIEKPMNYAIVVIGFLF
jgi:hypothetical protein